MEKNDLMREIPIYDEMTRVGQKSRQADGRQADRRPMAFSTGGIRHQKMW